MSDLLVDVPEPQQAGDSFGFSAWRGISHAMAAPHAHNDIEINLCASSLTYEAGGATLKLPAGVPAAFWGATPHQLIDVSSTAPLSFVTVPLARFTGWTMPPDMVTRLLRGEILIGSRSEPEAVLAHRFQTWAVDLAGQGASAERATALEVEALLLRMSAGRWSQAAPRDSHSSVTLRRAAEMALFVRAHASEPLRVSDVARVVHLHPNRAASLFREVFGVSVRRYLARVRVVEAQRLLLTTELDSAQIAARAGFQSLSSFHETFVASCGASPMRWRQRHRGHDSVSGRSVRELITDEYQSADALGVRTIESKST